MCSGWYGAISWLCSTKSTLILVILIHTQSDSAWIYFHKHMNKSDFFFRSECTPNKTNYTDWPVDVTVGYRDIVEKLHFLLDDHKLGVREKFKDVVFKPPVKKPNRILLKETLNLYLNRLPLPDTFDIDSEPVSDPIVISNAFYKHYSSIAVHLASNIPQVCKYHTQSF